MSATYRANRKKLLEGIDVAVLERDLKEWGFRKANGKRNVRLYFGLVLQDAQDVKLAKKLVADDIKKWDEEFAGLAYPEVRR